MLAAKSLQGRQRAPGGCGGGAPVILHHLTAGPALAMYRTLALVLAAVTTVTAEPGLEILNSPRVERFTNTLLGMESDTRGHENVGNGK